MSAADVGRSASGIVVAGPRVVALGGGHGLAASLSALRRVTDRLTAVVTVSDDGGSSGRLREEFGVLPPGDLRKALAALCGDDQWGRTWARVVQHRFESNGELHDHALGIRPRFDKRSDRARVVSAKENVGRLALFSDVIEVQSQHRGEVIGHVRGLGGRVCDRDADLHAARLVTLGFLSREDDKLGSLHRRRRITRQCAPPLR